MNAGTFMTWVTRITNSRPLPTSEQRTKGHWIPWTGNANADYISRLTGFDDWQITQNLFSSSEELWGPHTVAFFTNYRPKKLQRFFSHFRNLGISGTDFFPDLGFDNCLLVLPVFSCCSWCPLTVPTKRDSYSCCPSMAILLLLASSGEQILVVH